MPIPASGPLSMSLLMTELQNSGTTTNIRLSYIGTMTGSEATRTSGYTPLNQSSTSKPGLSPFGIAEWYSYNHSEEKICGSAYLSPRLGAFYTYYRFKVTGSVGSTSTSVMSSPDNNAGDTLRCQIYTSSYPFTNTGTLTGTPVFNGTFTNQSAQSYSFNLAATSESLHFVTWNETSTTTFPFFSINPSCGTTSTTTTLAPITFTTTASCNGSVSQILVQNFAGGSGTYFYIASGSTSSDAITAIQTTGSRFNITGPSYTFSNLANNTTFYITVMDSLGNFRTPPVAVTTLSCPITTTTTTTTSTTTTTTTVAASNNSYQASPCDGAPTVTIISSTALTVGSVYADTPSGTANCYTIDSFNGTTSSPTTGTYYLITSNGCLNARCAV